MMTYIKAGLGSLDRLPPEVLQIVLRTAFPDSGLDGFSRVNWGARARTKELAQHLQISLAKPLHIHANSKQSTKPLTQAQFEILVQSQDIAAALTPHASIVTRAHLRDWILSELRTFFTRVAPNVDIESLREFDDDVNDAAAKIWAAYSNQEQTLTLREKGLSSLPLSADALVSVRCLDLSYCCFSSFDILSKIPHLEKLSLEQNDFQSLQGVEKLPHLRVLDMESNESLTDLQGVQRCTKLEKLLLTNTQVEDLSPLVDVNSLKTLRVFEDVEIPTALQRPGLVIQRNNLSGASWEDIDPWHELPDGN